jgi:hypothetical protein
MLRGFPTAWLFLGLLTPAAACESDPAGQCLIGADCESGSCGANGQCNTGSASDGGPDANPGDIDAASSACQSVVDGIITQDELPMAPGRMANFRVASDATFDTAGSEADGLRTWDLDRGLANDVDTLVVLESSTNAWYADAFPGASYVSELSVDADLLGVFRLDSEGLYLLGVVSPASGLTRTELSYNPAVLLMPLPLSEGMTWNTNADVSGLASGVLSVYTEQYAGSANASGTLVSPYGEFNALRTRMDLTRTIGLLVTTTRQYNFVAECAGIVASIVSQENEQALEFDSAAEIRRLIP